MALLKIKSSAAVSKQVIIAAAAVNARTAIGMTGDCWVTSGNDSTHSPESKHYTDEALDFRVWGLSHTQIAKWAAAIRRRLGVGYDVVIESDHLHVEWDPVA